MLNNSESEDSGLTIHINKNMKLLKSASRQITEYIVPDVDNLRAFERYVGRTPLLRCNNLANYLSCEQLFVKFEGSNPTGTQKDRIAFALARYAVNSGFSAVTAASCGNFGVSLAFFGKILKIDTHIFIPANYHVPRDRMDRMNMYGAYIHYVPGTYEDAVEISRRYADEYSFFDANPGSDLNTDISVRAYAGIAAEIQSRLRRTPEYIICPVGNGTTIAGVYQGFVDLVDQKKSDRVPKIIAASTPRGNPIIHSFKNGEHIIADLDPNLIKETKVNEPLTNWHSYDGQLALDAIYSSRGYAEYATDWQMIKLAKLLSREQGINVLPASASTLAIIPKLYEFSNGLFERKDNLLKGSIVAILTGRGV